MTRRIKRSVSLIIILAGFFILIPVMMAIALSLPGVQTLIIKKITGNISRKIESTISVGKIEYSLFNRLRLQDLLLKDKNNDTLLYVSSAAAGIRKIDLRNNSIVLGRTVVTSPVVAFINDSTGSNNLRWYLDLIKNPEDTTKKNTNIFINQIDINKGRFALINRTREQGKTIINFNNLGLTGINGIVEDFKIRNDSVSFNIYNLTFRESSGFHVKKMSGEMLLADKTITFNSTKLFCDTSEVNISHLRIIPDSTGSFEDFINKVKLDLLLDRSLLGFHDLHFFVPALEGMKESVNLSAHVIGTISELKGRNVELSYRDSTLLDCDFDLSGLPEIENTFMYIGVNRLNISSNDFSNIYLPGKGNIVLPEIFNKLGYISFNGNFTGFTTDFVTFGKLTSRAGNISTDVSFRPENLGGYKIKGLVTGQGIALGKLTGETKSLGKLSMKANLDMSASSFKAFSGNMTGLIDSVEINDYKYRNISLNGIFSEHTWDGSVKISEPNIKMDLLGMFDFSAKLPEFDFTLNLAKADLYRLNMAKDTSAAVTMLLTANFKGSNIDNLDGEIKLLNSNLTLKGKDLEFYDFSLRTFSEDNKPAISLRTDYVDADVRGNYNFEGLQNTVRSVLATLIPSRFIAPPKSRNQRNKFTFNINLKNTDKINSFFNTGLSISEKSSLRGSIFPDSILLISANSRSLNYRNNILKDITVEAVYTSPYVQAKINSASMTAMGQTEFKDLRINLNAEPDNFILNLNWNNHDKIRNSGDIVARGTFVKEPSSLMNSVLYIDIDSTSIYNKNNRWKIDHSKILVDSNAIDINRLFISSNDNYYQVNGKISENPADTLHFEFRGIDLSPLNHVSKKKKEPDELSLDLKGILEGNILLTSLYKNPLVESNLKISNFSMLQSDYGEISVVSAWNSEKKMADIRVGNNLRGKKMIDVEGTYDPAAKKISLNISADKLPLDALNPLLKIFASDIRGTTTGKVNFTGSPGNIVLKGALLAENTSMKIDYLQTTYRINDSIRFARNNIIFKNITARDEKGNTAQLNGSVSHNNFRDYKADLVINTNDCMVLNTKPKDNELFYGTAFASGMTTIKSGTNSLSFDISATTSGNTKFYIPLNSSETVSEYSFITFLNIDTARQKETNKQVAVSAKSETTLDLNFDLEVTPDAEVQLIFDSKVGDIMRGHGNGNLNISYDQKGDFRISGDYIIEDGDYLFTLGNILNKPFTVENGGRIIFNGDIDDAEIDMKAIYKLKASLYEILQDERFNERIPVECHINLSGRLFNPVIGLDIFLPAADESTRTYLKNVITTEEELSRQFLYLLVMNSFYSDPSYRSGLTSTTSTGTSAMAVTTTEMVSNQLSNWLSQISNDFDIGFVYRPGYKDINANEVQLALSTQLLNDKVIINGNFDVRGTGSSSTSNDQLTGDFDIEYKITDKIRFKVFNRFNNPYTGKQAPYTQGFGLFFRQDFDKFSDLFRKKEKPDMKKEEEPVVMAE
jgi:hypothetical protein